MNKSNLKSYAPQARKDFIAAVTARAHQLGFTATHVNDATLRGDVLIIDGVEWPAKVAGQRAKLLDKILQHGFEQTMEEVAYTWFNRFAALRYMELHDFLEHGHRVLSSRDGGLPELLRHAADVSLPGLQAAKVQEMQLAGNRDDELYKALLVAQCNELSRVMPFLFERIDDETELLLPDNLLRTDSIVAKLVAGVPEEDWQEIEVIGWLYQFYISEKKDQVIGKVVKSEDIPAATQLFTPNWIVQYLVQNSVGRLWLMANPGSTLASQWPYYIQPAEQTPEVQAQLDALVQTRIREDGETLNPETITVLDPACGSGHILVVAYDVLKAIYLERGYQPRAIPRLILEKNLYGLDIDDRAAQLAAFALLMKARADDRRLFADPPKLNVLSLQSSAGLNYEELCTHLAPFGVQRHTIWGLIEVFEHAKTFGSLIQIPYQLKTQLAPLAQVLAVVMQQGDLYAQQAARDLQPLVLQAKVVAHQFDAVVANPPYMGGKGMNDALKEFAKTAFPDSKSDLFAMFMEQGFGWCKPSGYNGMVTMQSWMFLSSYEAMRKKLLTQRTIHTMAHLGAKAFAEISGEVVQTTAFVMQSQISFGYKSSFFRLVNGVESEKAAALRVGQNRFNVAIESCYENVPGSPISYWADPVFYDVFKRGTPLEQMAKPRQGMATTNNARFLRFWHEVSVEKIDYNCASGVDAEVGHKKWFPYSKGGGYLKWYGNNDYVVNFENNGKDVCAYIDSTPGVKVGSNGRVINREFYFKPAVTWSLTSSLGFCARWRPQGSIFDVNGMSIFADEGDLVYLLGLLNSKVANEILGMLNPTMAFQVGDICKMPVIEGGRNLIADRVRGCIELARAEWDDSEMSWGFSGSALLRLADVCSSTADAYSKWREKKEIRSRDLNNLSREIDFQFANLYGIKCTNEKSSHPGEVASEIGYRESQSEQLISYAIGCTMGRYSLDEPGLIYAHAGNVGFDPSRYEKKFPADADGIVPLTDGPWFTDDAASRVREFLRAVWGPDTLEENMAWLAESLGRKSTKEGSETPDETIRRYLADKFFKDHLQTYKKRPIYWLFSSGKQGAFQALVYLHRYHEGTLARMRAEYVVPLTGKMQARLDMLEKDAQAATSTAARNKISKEIEKLKKKHAELLAYDEKLRHHADMRIKLDLDDGVKVNYGKFGDLLAEVKAVTGGASDD